MKLPINLVLAMIYILGILSIPSYVAKADTMEYTVRANIPDNQINKDLTYFDLKMEPGQTQEISLTFWNSSNESIEIMIEPNRATTNQNGVIDYSQKEGEKDTSLIYDFTEIISEPQQLTIEADETKEIFFTLEMPDSKIDGIILGGFYIYQIGTDDNVQTAQIQNKYSYVIGVQLRMTDTEVKPDLTLNDIQATLINYRTSVTANLQNTEPINIRNLEVTAKVTKKGEETILHETTKTGLSMAPNSNFDFPISWDNQPLIAGEYHLSLTANDGQNFWEFQRDFEIEGEEAADLNEEAVELEKTNSLVYVILAIVVSLSIVIFVAVMINKRRECHKDE